MPLPLVPAIAGLVALWAFARSSKPSRSTLSPLVFGDSDFVVGNDGVPRLTSAAWSERIAQQLAARSVMPIAIYQDKNGEHRPAGLVKPGGPNALQWIADEVSKGRAVIVSLKNPKVIESVETRYVPYLANPSTGFGLLASPAESAPGAPRLSPLSVTPGDFYRAGSGALTITPDAWQNRVGQQLASRAVSVSPPAEGGNSESALLVVGSQPNALQWVANQASRGRTVLLELQRPEVLLGLPANVASSLAKESKYGVIAEPK